MNKITLTGATIAVALLLGGCGSSDDSSSSTTTAAETTRTIVQTVTAPTAETPEPEALTSDDETVVAAANLAAARYCVDALGHVVGDRPNPPSNAVIDRHIATADRLIEVIRAKPDAAREAGRELIRISARCQSPIARDVRRAMR